MPIDLSVIIITAFIQFVNRKMKKCLSALSELSEGSFFIRGYYLTIIFIILFKFDIQNDFLYIFFANRCLYNRELLLVA